MRVALYARVSTQEQAQHGLSIGAQIAALEEWSKPHVIVGEYIDAGVSGQSPIKKRPELQRLLHNLDGVDLVVFTKLDRWTRNIREYYKAQDQLDAHGVAWRAIHEDYETETAAGRLKVNIMLSVAQDEADRASERVKAVFADKRRRGLLPTASAPIGLKVVNGKYEITEDAQRARDIFARYIATRSSTAVAHEYGMTPAGVRYMLRNRVLEEQGVIDTETFEITQKILETRSQRFVRTDRVYLFSGLCRCGKCGAALYAQTSKNLHYYRCGGRAEHGICEGISVSEPYIEQFLVDNVVRKCEEINLTIVKKQGKKPSVDKLTARMNKLTDLYLSDLITKEKYEVEYRKAQEAVEEARKRPQAIDTAQITNILGAYTSLSKNAKKAFWCRLVKRIVVYDDKIDLELYP